LGSAANLGHNTQAAAITKDNTRAAWRRCR
jgi:hypothetical protein